MMRFIKDSKRFKVVSRYLYQGKSSSSTKESYFARFISTIFFVENCLVSKEKLKLFFQSAFSNSSISLMHARDYFFNKLTLRP